MELLDTAAKALGIGRGELEDRLADGKTLEEIARAEGTSIDDVRDAVRRELETRLDKAVDAGDLTRQADEMLSHVSGLLDDLGRLRLPDPPPLPWR